MRAGVAGGEHTENRTEQHTIEGDTDPVEVAQNKETVKAHIQKENGIAVVGGKVDDMAVVGDHVPIGLPMHLHTQGADDAKTEENDAKCIDDGGGCHGGIGNVGGSLQAHCFIQNTLEQKCHHAHGQRGGVQSEALVDSGGIVQAGRHEETDNEADRKGQRYTVDGESSGIGIGVTDHQLRNKGRKAGGEEHTVGVVTQTLFAHQAVKHHAGGGGEHVQRMDAPSAKTGGQ